MPNGPFIKKKSYNDFKVLVNDEYLQKDLKPNTVDINKLLNRVKLKEKSKKKENLVIRVIAIGFVSTFAVIELM